MADEQGQVETTTEDSTEDSTEDTGASETQAQDAQAGVTQAGASDSQDELESLRAALKKANSESASRRKKLEKIETEERQRQEAELSETERLKKQLEEAETARQSMADEIKGTRIRHAVEMTATGLRFHDPADAYALADLSDVSVDEDGAVGGVDDALKALTKSKPHLVKGAETPPDLNAQSRTNGAANLSDEEAERLAAVYGVRPEYVKKASG